MRLVDIFNYVWKPAWLDGTISLALQIFIHSFCEITDIISECYRLHSNQIMGPSTQLFSLNLQSSFTLEQILQIVKVNIYISDRHVNWLRGRLFNSLRGCGRQVKP